MCINPGHSSGVVEGILTADILMMMLQNYVFIAAASHCSSGVQYI